MVVTGVICPYCGVEQLDIKVVAQIGKTVEQVERCTAPRSSFVCDPKGCGQRYVVQVKGVAEVNIFTVGMSKAATFVQTSRMGR